MKYTKYHALGNDYIVIDPNKTKINLTEDNIKLICNRNFGVGSDGILLGPIIKEEKIHLRILNPDGSEAEKSNQRVNDKIKEMWSKGLLKRDKGGYDFNYEKHPELIEIRGLLKNTLAPIIDLTIALSS